MTMFNVNWADPVGRLVFVGWLFLPAVILALAIVLEEWRRRTRVRRFWCRAAGRHVEVTFVANAVHACSAFEPPDAITCRRACLDAAYRRQWEPALPVRTRRTRVG